MTHDRWEMLMNSTHEPLTEAEVEEGWHWCPEWDDLLIGPGMGELEHCGCLDDSHSARKVPVDD